MNERLYQQNFIDLLSEKHGMDKKDAEKFIKEFFLLIEEALEKDRAVKIKGLGTFKLVDVESRESVKVNTGERFQIQGYTKVAFVPDTSLRDIINKPFAHFETVVLNENTVLEDTPITESEDEGEETREETLPLNEEKAGVVIADVPAEEKEEEMIPDDRDAANEETDALLVEETVAVVEEDSSASAEIAFVEEESALPEGHFSEPENGEHPDMQQPQPVIEPKLSAEEIIARELAAIPPVVTPIVETGKRDKSPKREKTERSPLPYLIAIIVVVLILCGGALLFIYYPDLFDSHSKIEKVEKPANTQESADMPLPVVPQDTVMQKDTVGEVVSPVKEETPVAVPAPKKKEEAVKKDNKSTAKPTPFKPDSVNYKITGTKTVYTIKEGETLTRVALRFYGTKALWPYIVKHNPDVIKNPDHVPYGTTIKIPELVKK